MIDTSHRLILKAPRAPALCPLSSPASSNIFLFVYDFGFAGSAPGAGGLWGSN